MKQTRWRARGTVILAPSTNLLEKKYDDVTPCSNDSKWHLPTLVIDGKTTTYAWNKSIFEDFRWFSPPVNPHNFGHPRVRKLYTIRNRQKVLRNRKQFPWKQKKKVNKDDMVLTDSLSNQLWQRKYLDGLDRFLNGREARTPGHKLPQC